MSYWAHPKPVQRARAIQVEAVARAAVELLDDGGLRALTLRAAASLLDVAPASLYSRINTVDDLFDLALDQALGDDVAIRQACEIADLDELMLTYYRHLVAHPWACQVIAMRAPRGPYHLRLSEAICARLVQAGDPQPLATAYALSNFAIGSATTAHVASDESTAEVAPDVAPTYARLHREAGESNPEATFIAGVTALRRHGAGLA